MKVKRQRQTRRHLRFFRISCGFHEPFKVLCDGNFIHHATALKLTDLSTSIPKLLGAPAKAYTTRCVVAELRKLGPDFKDTVLAARKLLTHKCEHDPPLSASECMEAAVAGGNSSHFFTASQDEALRKKIWQMPGTALIRCRGTALILEPPSEFQEGLAREKESAAQHVTFRQQQAAQAMLDAVKKAKGQRLAPETQGRIALVRGENGLLEAAEQSGAGEGGALGRVDWRAGYRGAPPGNGDEEDEEAQEAARRRRLAMLKDGPRFKRKFAKGPNPLSCKPKKAKAPAPTGATKLEEHGRRKRQRRRSKGATDENQGGA